VGNDDSYTGAQSSIVIDRLAAGGVSLVIHHVR